MNRIPVFGVGLLCLGLTIGCGRTDDAQRAQTRTDDDIDIEKTTTLSETGCLTASADRFVLTALEGGGPTKTEMYELVGAIDDLRPHIGKEVRVTGVAEPAQVAELRESSPSTPTGTAGTEENQPRVQTQAQTRLETRQLRVDTIASTGNDCPGQRR
jgi:hypothetical protein